VVVTFGEKPMKVKGIAVDIDGTLTDEWRKLHLEAVRLLRELEGRGPEVVLATGNVLCVAETTRTMLGVKGPLIAENGGIISFNGEVEYLARVEEVEKAYHYLKNKLPVKKIPGSEYRKTEVALVRDYTGEEIAGILRGFEVEVVDTKFAVHLKSPRVSKGRALEMIGKRLGIKLEEFVALGDSDNDRDMLEKAGFSISIGEDLKEVADYCIPSVHGGGGKEALEAVLGMV